MQVNLSELKLIIIDEMSMISSDMLYNIHHRLCDILGSKNIFAGRGMVLVGDLFQLKPVHGRFIFEQPFQEKYEKHLEWLRPLDHLTRATKGFESGLDYMMRRDNSKDLQQFKDTMKKLDVIRDENMLEVFPELKELYETQEA